MSPSQTFPVEAAKHLEDVPTFHTDGTGGYLIYAGFDEVFVDDRAELFGPLYRRFVEAMSAHQGWEDLFEQYDIRQALLPNNNSLLSVLIAEGWRVQVQGRQLHVAGSPGATLTRLGEACSGGREHVRGAGANDGHDCESNHGYECDEKGVLDDAGPPSPPY